jgi:hypothetical protein
VRESACVRTDGEYVGLRGGREPIAVLLGSRKRNMQRGGGGGIEGRLV